MKRMTLMLIALLMGQRACAQYYEPEEYSLGRARYFSAGVGFFDFQPRSGNPLPESLAISFTKPMPLVGFSQDPVDLIFGYTRYSLRGVTRTAILLNATVTTEIPLGVRRGNGLTLPLCAVADFTKAEAAGVERDNFNFGSFGIGAGLKFRTPVAPVEFSASILGVIQFAFESYGPRTGSSSAIIGNATLLWRSAPILDGLVFGYRFRHQNWSLSDEQYNYKSIYHGPYIGALF
jgi:hypothetical protein